MQIVAYALVRTMTFQLLDRAVIAGRADVRYRACPAQIFTLELLLPWPVGRWLSVISVLWPLVGDSAVFLLGVT